jgi:hypothetical protein
MHLLPLAQPIPLRLAQMPSLLSQILWFWELRVILSLLLEVSKRPAWLPTMAMGM